MALGVRADEELLRLFQN